ncbi:hypothetical protein INT45_003248 [Circinella minor]|uniref:Galactose oxidase n=1 Tax=Circinella minor TaxID=1195481 RepID=A0A8H7SAN3_9FUNG|nr:hypothetical protein INT45_003248 [Circinella minor]
MMVFLQRRFALLILLLLFSIDYCHGYFNAPNLQTTLPFAGMTASAQRNNSLLLFGGETTTDLYTNDFFQLTQTENGFSWATLSQINPPPPTSMGQAVYVDGSDSLLLIGGVSSASNNLQVPIQIYLHDFASTNWQTWAGNNATNATGIPFNRKEFSVSLDNQASRIYVYGGSINDTHVFNDLWVLDMATMAFAQLPSSDVARYGHSTSLLSNGLLVVIGGVLERSTGERLLAPMDQLYVFDTRSNAWSIQNVTGIIPSSRSAHNAVIGSNDQIIVFGGDNGGDYRSRLYINSVAILDTESWTWTTPTPEGTPPSRRSYAAAGILDGAHLTVAFGASLNLHYNDINVLSLSDYKWLRSFDEQEEESSGLSSGVIAGIVIASVVLLIIMLFLLWRFQSYVRWMVTRIHGDIWRPRAGEPVWAETTRMCCKVFLLLVFAACLAFIIRQAVTSPNVIQRIEESVPQVDVPDIRFCFEGYPTYPNPVDVRNPGVVCQTNNGFSCSSFITPLNMSVFSPVFTSSLGPVSCFLFRAPNYFQMTETSGVNNGSHLLFYPFGDTSITYGRIHVSTYPKEMDPNVKVYGIQDDINVIMSDVDVVNWMNGERNDIQTNNIYSMVPSSYSALGYELVDHQYLQNVGWNYIGFSPITNSTPQIETSFRQEAPNPNYTLTHPDLGLIAIYPSKFVLVRDREVKMYTLLNALGFVGGIFGLLLALQTWLFGYRPRSPWGVVQRWSIGDMRQSLLNGLSSNFRTAPETGIPFIHPVHRRFSVLNTLTAQETERERIARVEERMQVLELLFKAYYVDDEVFRSLDNANRRETGIIPNSDSGPLFPPSLLEKGIRPNNIDAETSSRSSQDGISLRNHRRSSTSNSSDDTPSRQPLNP